MNMNRIHLLYSCLSIACVAGSVNAYAAKNDSQQKKKPNILFCVADDAGHFSAYGHRWINTPNFDKVARQGVLFDNAFTCNSKSAPSRACMITGRNSWQLEEAANHWCNF